jgi:PIN domain nuclease of toxin-antitoxin system
MKYLIDTHIVIWIIEDSPRLTETMRRALMDEDSKKYVSMASAWEVALKLGTGKIQLVGGLQAFFDILDKYGISTLPIEREYLEQIPNLPVHHKDPFDHLLIATAIAENMTLITADQNMQKYNVPYVG